MTDPSMVYHPAHYNTDSGIECLKVIRYLPFALANACKYVWRYRGKWEPQEDLEKAAFYLDDFENFLFKHKDADMLFHSQVAEAAKLIMGTKVRDMFRTHILHLQTNAHPEAGFFEALYAFLQQAQFSRVSYELYTTLGVELAELRARTATQEPAEEQEDSSLAEVL